MNVAKITIEKGLASGDGKFPALWDFRIVIDEESDYVFDTAKEAEEAAEKELKLMLKCEYQIEVEVIDE